MLLKKWVHMVSVHLRIQQMKGRRLKGLSGVQQPLPKLMRSRHFFLLHKYHDPLYPAFSPSLIIFNSYTPAMQVSLQQRADEDHQDHPAPDRHHNTFSLDVEISPSGRQESFCVLPTLLQPPRLPAGKSPLVPTLNCSTCEFALCWIILEITNE